MRGIEVAAVVVGGSAAALPVYASDDWAKAGVDTGAVVISRTGPLDQALTVYFDIGGSARDRAAPLGNAVTFAAGEQQKRLVVRPLAQARDGKLEITLRPDPSYTLGKASGPAERLP